MERKTDFGTRDRWLLFAFILAPAAWLLHLNVSYMLVPESCGDGTKWMLHVVTLVCLAAAAAAAWIAWNIRRRAESDRMQWMAMLVMTQAFAMMVVILAQEIPNLMLRSCD